MSHGALNEKQIRYLVRIKSNTDRLSRLINDLLDLPGLSPARRGSADRLPLTALAEEVAEHPKPLATES
jgi:signal transduction histidine kinase